MLSIDKIYIEKLVGSFMSEKKKSAKWQIKIAKLKSFLETAVSILMLLFVAFSVVLTVMVVFVILAYIQLGMKNIDNLVPFKALAAFRLLNAENVTREWIIDNTNMVKSTLEFYMNIGVALYGFIMTFATFVSYFRKRAQLRQVSCFEKHLVTQKGKEDIDVLLKYYRGASRVVSYSHSFSWVKRNEENNNSIRDVLLELAKKDKLTLYTPSLKVAKENLQNYPELLNCLHETTVEKRFSYVERDSAQYLQYLLEDSGKTYAMVVRKTAESGYLLDTISDLLR